MITDDLSEYVSSKYLPIYLETIEDAGPLGQNMYIAVGRCPVDILVTTPSGNKVGSVYKNESFSYIVNEVSHSLYTGPDVEPELILILDPENGMYFTDVYANDNGTYNLSICYVQDYNISEQKEYMYKEVTMGNRSNYSMNVKFEEKNTNNQVYTNGFELILVIVAVAFILFFKRKKRV